MVLNNVGVSKNTKPLAVSPAELVIGPPWNEKAKENQMALVPVRPSYPVRLSQRLRHRNDSLITQRQRDTLVVSSFGIGTTQHGQVDRCANMIKDGLSTAAGSATCESIVMAQSEKDSVRFHLCIDALGEGCVNTFIHLFHLSHRDPVCVDQLAQTLFTIPDDKLKWVKEQLAAVEVLRRQSEFREVFERCRLLADYFESERDYEEAAWHYDVGLRYAMESLDRSLEQEVRLAFGAFFERRKQLRKTIFHYEEVYHLALSLNDTKVAAEASCHLTHAYLEVGLELKTSDPRMAIQFLLRSLEMSRRRRSAEDEAESLRALGSVYEHMGNLNEALRYQKMFLEVSKGAKLLDKERHASLCIANIQERLHMVDEAVESLKCALQLAEEAEDLEGIYRATLQLGQAYDSSGGYEQALGSYRANFDVARRLNDSNLTDQARVALGFALGENYLKNAGGGRGYVPIVCEDVEAQLQWMSKGVL
uniref:Tetratricopeptide repeat protein 29 n=1 Tax=Trypanosoma congolense (strain IL3000) TaxID=1068625 RepID=G0UJX9_TRYCI|nr:unnamed protein product [Trypanosoma congolense IL3000]